MKLKVSVSMASLSILFTLPFVCSEEQAQTPAQNQEPYPECADCSQFNQTDPARAPGFWCKTVNDTNLVVKSLTEKAEFPECMPEPFVLTEDIKDYCCFWGPKLPCGQLVGARQQEKWHESFPNTCHLCEDACFPKAEIQYCADCKAFNARYYRFYRMPTETGYSCSTKADSKKISIGARKKAFTFRNTCVPAEYAIDGQVFNDCCFWSPKMGCGKLIGKAKRKSCEECVGRCPRGNSNQLRFIYALLALSVINCLLT